MRVVHVLRAPVGGLFRHVRDLVAQQAAAGFEVGVVCDSSARDTLTDARLNALVPYLALGLHFVAMSREVGISDISAFRAVRRLAKECNTDILHGHGAKGGAYARLAAASIRSKGGRIASFYTPHGGSLHYDPKSLKGRVFMGMERRLAAMTSGLIFESAYSADVYARQVGQPACATRIIPNGLLPEEFGEHQLRPDAADILFIGELRMLKGVDVLLDAIATLSRKQPVSAVIVGDGPDRARFEEQTERAGLSQVVRFPGAMPAREAFGLGKMLAMPSRAESFPYIVLEAAAASVPMVATDVGGIPEIVDGTDTRLVPPGDATALAANLQRLLTDPKAAFNQADNLRRAVAQRFTVEKMVGEISDFYQSVTKY